MADKGLQSFVRECLARGASRQDIARGLRTAAWPEREIQDALGSSIDAGLPLPVPKCRASTGPREAFLHLLLFSSLATWMIALGSLLFDLINIWFPLPGEQPMNNLGSLRIGVASVIVAFPLFGFVLRRIRRDIAANPARGMDPIRRWLSYMALFAAALILLGDGIGVIISFLNGDLTTRFLLKAVVVASLAGGVFWWLQQSLHERPEPPGGRRVLWYGLCVIVIATIATSAGITGGPLQARLRDQDRQRVNDLRSIHHSVRNFSREQGRLPATLEECNSNPGTFISSLKDPVTDEPYGYEIKGDNRFVLMATFNLPSRLPSSGRNTYDPQGDSFWKHGSGPAEFTIDLGTRRKKDGE